MNQCTQPELFYSQKNKLHDEYVAQLTKTMAEYPSYKLSQTSKYAEELSILNGITADIDKLKDNVNEHTVNANNIIEQGDTDLQNLKNIESNLAGYTSYEELDITSKQLLSDATQDYAKHKIIFYIKGMLILILLYKLIGSSRLQHVLALTIVLYCIVSLYLYFTNSYNEV
jgi:hypothetical protein